MTILLNPMEFLPVQAVLTGAHPRWLLAYIAIISRQKCQHKSVSRPHIVVFLDSNYIIFGVRSAGTTVLSRNCKKGPPVPDAGF